MLRRIWNHRKSGRYALGHPRRLSRTSGYDRRVDAQILQRRTDSSAKRVRDRSLYGRVPRARDGREPPPRRVQRMRSSGSPSAVPGRSPRFPAHRVWLRLDGHISGRPRRGPVNAVQTVDAWVRNRRRPEPPPLIVGDQFAAPIRHVELRINENVIRPQIRMPIIVESTASFYSPSIPLMARIILAKRQVM